MTTWINFVGIMLISLGLWCMFLAGVGLVIFG